MIYNPFVYVNSDYPWTDHRCWLCHPTTSLQLRRDQKIGGRWWLCHFFLQIFLIVHTPKLWKHLKNCCWHILLGWETRVKYRNTLSIVNCRRSMKPAAVNYRGNPRQLTTEAPWCYIRGRSFSFWSCNKLKT